MICPKCKLNKLEAKMETVICSNCGFKASLLEYNTWKKVSRVKPLRREKSLIRDYGRNFSETFANIEDLFQDRRFQRFLLIFALLIMFLIILSV
ncbi:MAG: hypothetical protein QG670_1720 [Thermoproteota archaeon]|nr:hypothetical protein [Thermoproteota archaeon]